MKPILLEDWGNVGVVLPVQFAALVGPGTRFLVADTALVVKGDIDKRWPHLIEFWPIEDRIPSGRVYILRWRPKPHVRQGVGMLQTSGGDHPVPSEVLSRIKRSVEYVRSMKLKS